MASLTPAVCDPRAPNTHPSPLPLPPHRGLVKTESWQHRKIMTEKDRERDWDKNKEEEDRKTTETQKIGQLERETGKNGRGRVRRETETVRDAGPKRQGDKKSRPGPLVEHGYNVPCGVLCSTCGI